MPGNSTRFSEFIADEVNKYQGRIVPVKASLIERIVIRNVSCRRLHPNPYDEFSFPDIGPNYEIISGYERRIKEARVHGALPWDDPILVEKVLPGGYLILNGHHRWAAAIRIGMPRVRIRVVNLTQETDIKKMLSLSEHDRRVSFDLDEVIFAREDSADREPINAIQGRLIKERLRLGVPALFHFLARNGYDIWVYSSEYYSTEYIQRLFKGYHVPVNGVVTGTRRVVENNEEARERVKNMFSSHYSETLHIDGTGIVRSFSDGREFEQYELSGEESDWSREVMQMIEKVKKGE